MHFYDSTLDHAVHTGKQSFDKTVGHGWRVSPETDVMFYRYHLCVPCVKKLV